MGALLIGLNLSNQTPLIKTDIKRTMRTKREAIPVTLTPKQREDLERLWFYYGNYGPKTTRGNHSFIQGLLEHGLDLRPLKQRGYIPTDECVKAVESVLSKLEKEELQKDSASSL